MYVCIIIEMIKHCQSIYMYINNINLLLLSSFQPLLLVVEGDPCPSWMIHIKMIAEQENQEINLMYGCV